MEAIYQFRYGNYVEINNDVWFFNQNFNGLLCVDKDNGRVKRIYRDWSCPAQGRFLYAGVVYHDGKLILLPLLNSKIAIFDLCKESFEYLEIDTDRLANGFAYSICHYQEESTIYLFPANMSALIKIQLDSKQIQYINAGIEEKVKLSKGFVFRNQFEVIDHKIYIPFTSCSGIAIYNLETDSFEVKLDEIVENCSTISHKDGKVFLGSWNEKRLYIWDLKTDIVETRDMDVDTETERIFNGSIILENKLVLIPYHSEKIFVFDIQTYKSSCVRVEVDMQDNNTCYQIEKRNGTACFSGANDIKELVYEDDRIEIRTWLDMDEQYNKRVIAKYLLDNGIYSMAWEKEGSLKEMLSLFVNYN